MNNSPEIQARYEFAAEISRRAGDLTLQFYRSEDLQIDCKADSTPVTIADRGAEKLLRELIEAKFPDDGIFGEEYPERKGKNEFRWILDPIDGTKAFIHGVPLYGVLIGVELAGESVIGVIHIPALSETVYAAKGLGAKYVWGDRPPRPARVSNTQSLSEALFLTSEVRTFEETKRRSYYDALQSAARLTRTWGDCYGYLLVATGRADLMVDPAMALWDAAALKPILEEAGGTFTDWKGERTIYSGEGVATNGLILDEALELLK